MRPSVAMPLVRKNPSIGSACDTGNSIGIAAAGSRLICTSRSWSFIPAMVGNRQSTREVVVDGSGTAATRPSRSNAPLSERRRNRKISVFTSRSSSLRRMATVRPLRKLVGLTNDCSTALAGSIGPTTKVAVCSMLAKRCDQGISRTRSRATTDSPRPAAAVRNRAAGGLAFGGMAASGLLIGVTPVATVAGRCVRVEGGAATPVRSGG